MRLLQRLAEEERHALQRHVLERQRRAVPELEHEAAFAEILHGSYLGVSEVGAVGGGADAMDVGGAYVQAEGLVDQRRPLRIGKRGHDVQLGRAHLRQLPRHEQPAAGRDALQDDLREGPRAVDQSSGVRVGDHARVLRRSPGFRRPPFRNGMDCILPAGRGEAS